MANCCESVSQQTAEVNALNSKLAYDFAAQLQNQALLDSQAHARALNAIAVRRAENAATIDHMVNGGSVLAGQAGVTEGQQTVSPVRTATGDAIVGGVGVAAEQVAANVAALSDVVVKFGEVVSALAAITVAQVQPKG